MSTVTIKLTDLPNGRVEFRMTHKAPGPTLDSFSRAAKAVANGRGKSALRELAPAEQCSLYAWAAIDKWKQENNL